MGTEGTARGIISKDQLDQLVKLFDRSEYAQDPNSRDAKEAESDFNTLVDALHQEAIKMSLPLEPAHFKALVRRRCQQVIVSETKKPTSLPPVA